MDPLPISSNIEPHLLKSLFVTLHRAEWSIKPFLGCNSLKAKFEAKIYKFIL